MMKRYDKDAALEASYLADALLEKGDMEGCAAWKRILNAIEELERTERTADEILN